MLRSPRVLLAPSAMAPPAYTSVKVAPVRADRMAQTSAQVSGSGTPIIMSASSIASLPGQSAVPRMPGDADVVGIASQDAWTLGAVMYLGSMDAALLFCIVSQARQPGAPRMHGEAN